MRHPGVFIAESGSKESETWYKLVGIVRTRILYQDGKIISFYSYIDYGITSEWFPS